MIKNSIEKLAGEIGFDIGNSDDEIQSNLLNGLCKGLANSMDDRSLDMQLCYIVNKLNRKSCKILKQLTNFIILKESDNK